MLTIVSTIVVIMLIVALERRFEQRKKIKSGEIVVLPPNTRYMQLIKTYSFTRDDTVSYWADFADEKGTCKQLSVPLEDYETLTAGTWGYLEVSPHFENFVSFRVAPSPNGKIEAEQAAKDQIAAALAAADPALLPEQYQAAYAKLQEGAKMQGHAAPFSEIASRVDSIDPVRLLFRSNTPVIFQVDANLQQFVRQAYAEALEKAAVQRKFPAQTTHRAQISHFGNRFEMFVKIFSNMPLDSRVEGRFTINP